MRKLPQRASSNHSSWKIEFTMHIRGELNNPYTLEARLFYPDGPAAEPQTFTFDVKPPYSPGEPECRLVTLHAENIITRLSTLTAILGLIILAILGCSPQATPTPETTITFEPTATEMEVYPNRSQEFTGNGDLLL